MRMTQETEVLKGENLDQAFAQLKGSIQVALRKGQPAHEVELSLWKQLLQLGHQLFGQFLAAHGSGDMGETVTWPDGRCVERLEELHKRRLVSIFGEFVLNRTVYGSRAKQKIEFVPLDNRLQLPENEFSYVLQDWDQELCVEEAFSKAAGTIWRILGLNQSVDSLERMNVHMAKHVEDYRADRAFPVPADEGEILVLAADGKGIVMRRKERAPAGHRTKGEKASQKRMAVVGTAYTVDRYVRTPEEVVAALFGDRPAQPPPPRPPARHKHVWASLPQEAEDGSLIAAVDIVYPWLLNEVVERNRRFDKEMVCVHDGQESLWEARQRHLPHKNSTDILDLLHVTPRLWQAAHVFCPEGSEQAEQFVRWRLLKVLRGRSDLVVRGLRVMASKRPLRGSKKATLTKVCAYLEQNRQRMHYDVYLAKGYPIASGAIEGACRHLVKDRMERAGMHWAPRGAQAMLDVRSTWVNGDWESYQNYFRERETTRLYPYRHLTEAMSFALAA
jgi:hypothetical protein